MRSAVRFNEIDKAALNHHALSPMRRDKFSINPPSTAPSMFAAKAALGDGLEQQAREENPYGNWTCSQRANRQG